MTDPSLLHLLGTLWQELRALLQELCNVKWHGLNHKLIYGIYCELELNLRIKPKNRMVGKQPEPLLQPEAANQAWPRDFMHGQLQDGKAIACCT